MTIETAPGRPTWFVSAEDFLGLPDTRRLELEDGAIARIRMNNRSNWVARQIRAYLREFVGSRSLGEVLPAGTMLRCFPRHPDRVRRPVAAFVALGRSAAGEPADGYASTVSDLIVDVVSPGDSACRVERKQVEYH